MSAEKSFETEATKQQQVAEEDGEERQTEKKPSAYDRFSKRDKADKKCEILIWNIQKDMIELFSINPPWNIAACRKFIAHDDSIVDICYLTKAQLLVTSSLDQTVRFCDPVSTCYDLTDPSNNPHA